MNKVFAILCLLIPCIIWGKTTSVEAAETTSTQISTEKKTATDNIFEEVMQSLPENVKMKIDSVAGKKTENHRQESSAEHKIKADENINRLKNSDLSDDLRKKVEKAMNEIDRQQSKRELQFKESQKKRH